ncbi:adrenodoxin-like protein Fdx1, mitochondrial [Acrasis kona]|uniref:Adrenodoxin-like protein Fdx1, mitochondrial n=1 Tax=Acrasis kona TaxID=1008807 RepID=A0AAW2ZD66_9EUKA
MFMNRLCRVGRGFNVRAFSQSHKDDIEQLVMQYQLDAAFICHSSDKIAENIPQTTDNTVEVVVVDNFGSRIPIRGLIGKSLLDVIREHELPLWAGKSCGSLDYCTSCHVVVSNEAYDSMIQPDEDEAATCDIAFGASTTASSRLACKIVLERALDGMIVSLPPRSPTASRIDDYFSAN